MDPRFTSEMLKHLEKQNELLMESYNSMAHELHKLQVEEEMLMRKFYELMVAQGFNKKKEATADGGEAGDSSAFLINTSNVDKDGENGESTAIAPTTNTIEQ